MSRLIGAGFVIGSAMAVGAGAYCIDLWSRGGASAKMTRTTQLNFSQCTP